MNILDIIGPVMVGPSSSHTAGAVRIGLAARKLLGEEVRKAEIYFHGSFMATGRGHGTDRAVVAGLLGFAVEDERIPESFAYAGESGLAFSIRGIDLGDDVHANTVKMNICGESGRGLEVIASSIGGGRIWIDEIDGLNINVGGEYPTLIVHNLDEPGHVTGVTSLLADRSVNIAAMQLYRMGRGGEAVMLMECDQEIPGEAILCLRRLDGIRKVTYLNMGIGHETEEGHVRLSGEDNHGYKGKKMGFLADRAGG